LPGLRRLCPTGVPASYWSLGQTHEFSAKSVDPVGIPIAPATAMTTSAADLAEPVSRIMTEGPVTVPSDTAIGVAARLLLEERIGALPVREGERMVGVFTTADALDALLGLVESPPR
jgi:predicted transcriptional regulator